MGAFRDMWDMLNSIPKLPRGETVTDPNGRQRRLTTHHLVVVASDGVLHCDRCKNGHLLSCMDACRCGRVG